MEKFTTLTGVPAPMDMINIDTDMIIPKQFLKSIERTGFGKSLFFEMRYRDDGSENPDFVLNKPQYRDAKVLIAGDNFGCGSSREHAPQSLREWGIEIFIAQSFAEIFFGNCVAMGLPCLTASAEGVSELMAAVEEDPSRELAVHIAAQTITVDGRSIEATMPSGPREQLIKGEWDALGQLLAARDEIAARAGKLPYVRGFR